MNWNDAVTDPEERLVFAALDEPDCTWRAVDAIADDTDLAENRVLEIVRKYSGTFTCESSSRSLSGAPLVALVEHVPLDAAADLNPHFEQTIGNLRVDLERQIHEALEKKTNLLQPKQRIDQGEPKS